MAIRVLRNLNFHERVKAGSLLMDLTITLFYLILVLIISLHGQICNAQVPTNMCNRGFNYTNGSQFERNLNAVFERLLQRTNQTGFNISAYGQSPDRIYGLLQCRADKTADQCYSCAQFATTHIVQICGNAVGGSIWPFECFLRYENYSFIGQLDTDIGSTYVEENIVYNPIGYDAAVQKLLRQLSVEAAAGTKRSAIGTAIDSVSQRFYGLVQCTRDLSPNNCTTCLSYTINHIFGSYPGNGGVQLWGQSCIIRYEVYPFFPSTLLPPLYPVDRPAISSREKCSNKTPIILAVVEGFFLALIVCVFATRRRLKSAIFHKGYGVHEQVQEDTPIISDGQTVFTMETLLDATENFHDNNKLGEGGFGPVYKGTLSHGKEVAVKKLSLKSIKGKEDFLKEVQLTAKIQHRNLVNLLGCCAEGSERLLVYEYLPNKSLDKILFDPIKRIQLDWQKRYNIILGVARGLLYLHQDFQLPIIHLDIKASNILLDEKLNPKISDFSLARLFHEDETHIRTTVAGTCGYIAPEYGMQGQLSVKTDVYGFGVLLLELITGRKNTDYNLLPEMQILLEWTWRLYEGGTIEQLIDRAIIETGDKEQALRCIHVGLLCTQSDPSLRPPMSTVTMMLSMDSMTTLPDPTKPTVFAASPLTQNTSSPGAGLPDVSAPQSITELVPRGAYRPLDAKVLRIQRPVGPPGGKIVAPLDFFQVIPVWTWSLYIGWEAGA